MSLLGCAWLKHWSDIQQSVSDQAIDQWRIRLNACVKAKGKHFEHMLWCVAPQLSIICYEFWNLHWCFASRLLTSHNFWSFNCLLLNDFDMFIEYNTVTKTLSAKVTFLTMSCYKFIQVPACKKYQTINRLDSVIANTRRVQFLRLENEWLGYVGILINLPVCCL